MLNKIFDYLKHPYKFLYALNNKGLIYLNDKSFLKIRYRCTFNRKLDLNNPQTFNEKLQWLKLHDRKEVYTTMVDKFDAKQYVSNIIGEEYIIPTIGVYNSFDEIDFKKLPNQFVMKCTHDSGGLIICKNKNNLNVDNSRSIITKCLNKNYYPLGREWPYKNVKPRIIIEKYMKDNQETDLKDYKIFCFNGVPEVILVCSNRNGSYKNTDFYDTAWNLLPFTREKHTNNPQGIAKPHNLQKMLEIASVLSKDIPFVRVDLYEINKKIYFGELTFFPSAGFEGFSPIEWDYKLGEKININEVIKNEE